VYLKTAVPSGFRSRTEAGAFKIDGIEVGGLAGVNKCQGKPNQSEKTKALRVPPHIVAVLMLGTVAQTGQILFLREFLMAFHGNEFLIGLILSTWLAWVGVGSYLGAYLADRFNRPLFLLMLNAAGVLLALPATVFFIRNLRWFFDVLPGAHLSLLDMSISSFLLLAPVCILLGIQFVLLARVWRESEQATDTSSAGKTYVGEAVGGVLGGILFTFLMVHYLNSVQIAVLAGMVMLFAIWLIIPKSKEGANKMTARCRLVLSVLLTIAAMSYPFLNQADAWAHKTKWQHFLPEHELAGIHKSQYGTIAVVKLEEQYSFYQSGHLIFSIVGPLVPVAGLEEQEAVLFAHLSMVQHENPADVLLIGGGLRGMLSEMLKHPVDKIDYIELDEALTRAALPHLTLKTRESLADPRVRLIHTDGRIFLRTTENKYDLIIVDAPDPATQVLNRYFTKEFFREAALLLRPGGVLVIGAVSTPGLRGTAIANRNATIYHTLAAVFPRVLLAGDRFMFFFATNAPQQISVDAATLAERFRRRGIEAKGFSPQHYYLLLEETKLERVNWIIRNHGRSPTAQSEGPKAAPLIPGTVAEQERMEKLLPPVYQHNFINSDFKPTGYFYTLMFLDELARAGYGIVFQWMMHVRFWWILAIFALPLFFVSGLRFALVRHGQKSAARLAVLFSILAMGFSAMTLQIALLFTFQSIYGVVFEMVGLIMAIFMGGLALGAFLTSRYVANKADLDILAGSQLLITLLAGTIAVLLPVMPSVQSPAGMFTLFSLLTFIAGLINGFGFPLSLACAMTLDRHAEKSAGAVYGVELFGACLGAILASMLVVPIFGIVACSLLAVFANGAALLTLLIARRSYRCQQQTQTAV